MRPHRKPRNAESRVGAASENVTTAAGSVEELAASISEIAGQANKSTEVASRAVEESRRTTTTMSELGNAATRIGEVVSLIQAIAGQTNLLALNATIEAARAGEAGRGFAVVAQEVKSLAGQTAKATEEIAGQIGAIQSAAADAAQALHQVNDIIEDMSTIAASVAATVEEQNSAVNSDFGRRPSGLDRIARRRRSHEPRRQRHAGHACDRGRREVAGRHAGGRSGRPRSAGAQLPCRGPRGLTSQPRRNALIRLHFLRPQCDVRAISVSRNLAATRIALRTLAVETLKRWWNIALDAFWQFNADDGWAIASHIALSGLMSLFPFFLVLTAVAGIIGSTDLASEAARLVLEAWPEQVSGPIALEIQHVLEGAQQQVLTVGAALALVLRVERRRKRAHRAQSRLFGRRQPLDVAAAAGIDRLRDPRAGVGARAVVPGVARAADHPRHDEIRADAAAVATSDLCSELSADATLPNCRISTTR